MTATSERTCSFLWPSPHSSISPLFVYRGSRLLKPNHSLRTCQRLYRESLHVPERCRTISRLYAALEAALVRRKLQSEESHPRSTRPGSNQAGLSLFGPSSRQTETIWSQTGHPRYHPIANDIPGTRGSYSIDLATSI